MIPLCKDKYVTGLDEMLDEIKSRANNEGLHVLSETELLLMITKNAVLYEKTENDN